MNVKFCNIHHHKNLRMFMMNVDWQCVSPQLNVGPVVEISLTSLSFPKVDICENTGLIGEEMKPSV
jgi:hypothetical protein